MKLIKITAIMLLLAILLKPYNAFAVMFSKDYISLYEDGKKIDNNSVIVTYDIYRELCQNGGFVLGQQFSRNLTFYKINEPLLNEHIWRLDSILTDKDCAGNITRADEIGKALNQFEIENKSYHDELEKRRRATATREEAQKILDEWGKLEVDYLQKKGLSFFYENKCWQKDYGSYLEEHINVSVYHANVVIPEANRAGIGKLGKIGDDRYFNVDIKTGEIMEQKTISGFGSGSFSYDKIRVKRVIDGDSIILEDGNVVRLIGIDAPECYAEPDKGRAALEFTSKLVLGKIIRIEKGKMFTDYFQRMLAYVYLMDGTFVNAEIIKQGYAKPMKEEFNRTPYKANDTKYANLFEKLYGEAKRNKRGLWSEN